MEKFDPYHKWLGIRPKDQPPNHYRLLSIDLFEDDPDVIDAAAEQRITFLRHCATGEHQAESQRLLNEVSIARLCLLTQQSRAEYDVKLNQQIAANASVDSSGVVEDLSSEQPKIDLTTSGDRLHALTEAPPVSAAGREANDTVTIWRQRSAFSPLTALTLIARSLPQWRPLKTIGAFVGCGLIALTFAVGSPFFTRAKPGDAPPISESDTLPTSASSSSVSGPSDLLELRDMELPSLPSVNGASSSQESKSEIETAPLMWNEAASGSERDDNPLNLRLVRCSNGKFTMGRPRTEMTEGDPANPVDVILTHGFWLGKYEVTQNQWEQVMKTAPWQVDTNVRVGGDYPASYVTWYDAVEVCRRLTQQERAAHRLPSDWVFALPTEAQWEYACRAGSPSRFCFGDDESKLLEYAWFDAGRQLPSERSAHPVGTKRQNSFGLCDMHGNLREWCRDAYVNKLPGGEDPLIMKSGSRRILRGGSWDTASTGCGSAERYCEVPLARRNFLGLRVAAVPNARSSRAGSSSIPSLRPPPIIGE